MKGDKPKVVVLHGTAGNGGIMKFQIGALSRKLSDYFDVVFMDAPRLCEEESNRHVAVMRKVFGAKQVLRQFAVASEDARGWRTYEDVAAALASTAEAVRSACGGEEPRAIIAFSQGANFATMLVAQAEGKGHVLPSVLMCGARPGWTLQLPELFERNLRSPAFIVAADNDPVVHDGPKEMANLFEKATFRSHADGHKPLPSDRANLDALTTDISDFLKIHCSSSS